MRIYTTTLVSTATHIDSVKNKRRNFTTKQKAEINKCLERVNQYLFECYDCPEKVYKLTDIYNVLDRIIKDGLADNIDEAITIFRNRLN